jgi:heme/copper-type cytochrome/quinol oxidase subunit 1
MFGFGAWAAGTKVADAIVLPTYSPLTAAVLLPIGALVLLWLDTLRRADRLSGGAALGFVAAFIVCLGGGVLAAVIAGVNEVEGTAWSSGQVHLLATAAPLLLAVGALHHWAPKLWGRAMPATAGAAQTLLLLGGAAILAVGQYLAGWDAQDRGVNMAGDSFSRISAVGGIVFLLGAVAVFLMVLAREAKTAQPVEAADDGLTLEWAAPSPPPPHNFDTLPEVRSDTPVADLKKVSA